MTAEEKQFLEAGELAAYINTLILGGATSVQVVPTVKSWYLIIYN